RNNLVPAHVRVEGENEKTKRHNNLDELEDRPDVLRDNGKVTMPAVLIDQLITFVNTELSASIEGTNLIDEETPILELGILDSLTMVSLLAFIHARFGVHVP